MALQLSNESNFSFFHIASVYPKATKAMIEQVRKIHPNNPYFLAVDGNKDYSEIAKNNNCHLQVYPDVIGGPVPPYGFDLPRTLEFLKRFKDACEQNKTSHIIMMEDDVWIRKQVTIDTDWNHAGADTKIGNIVPEFVHDAIEKYSGGRLKSKQYGAGGGTIFNAHVFLENYNRNIEWFKKYFNSLQPFYPTIGYVDCFMNIYFWLCGKECDANQFRTDTHNHQPGFDYDNFMNNLEPQFEIVNNYKKYYYE